MSMDILRNKKYTRYVYYTVAIAFVVSLALRVSAAAASDRIRIQLP